VLKFLPPFTCSAAVLLEAAEIVDESVRAAVAVSGATTTCA
jgi:hypothetical protein